MLCNELREKQKLLIVRYGTEINSDCIELHKKLIEQYGFCWFGKIGVVPSKASITPVMREERPAIILYNRKGVFLCDVEEIIYSKPPAGYPDYYEQDLFANYMYPKCYMKLTSIDEINIDDVAGFYVVSSGNSALDTLNNSMSSFLFITRGQLSESEKRTIKESKRKESNVKRPMLPSNDCIYRKNGICTLKTCISYEFECERPSMCLKQKR